MKSIPQTSKISHTKIYLKVVHGDWKYCYTFDIDHNALHRF